MNCTTTVDRTKCGCCFDITWPFRYLNISLPSNARRSHYRKRKTRNMRSYRRTCTTTKQHIITENTLWRTLCLQCNRVWSTKQHTLKERRSVKCAIFDNVIVCSRHSRAVLDRVIWVAYKYCNKWMSWCHDDSVPQGWKSWFIAVMLLRCSESWITRK